MRHRDPQSCRRRPSPVSRQWFAHAAGADSALLRQRPSASDRHGGGQLRTTHAHPEAIDACRYFAGIIVGALQARSKDDLLRPMFSPVGETWGRQSFTPAIEDVARGSFSAREPPSIRAPAMSRARSRPPSGRLPRAPPSSTARCSPSTLATMRIRRAQSMGSWRGRSTELTRSRSAGARSWRSSRCSSASRSCLAHRRIRSYA